MSIYITTHDTSGNAVFSDKIPAARHKITAPWGSIEIVYSEHTSDPDLASEVDIDQYDHDRINAFGHGNICPTKGSAFTIIEMNADTTSPLHRTLTLDTIYIAQGVVELSLDLGEMRTLTAGDTVVLRGPMHQWKNVTPDGGIVKMVGSAQSIAVPFKVGAEELKAEWKE